MAVPIFFDKKLDKLVKNAYLCIKKGMKQLLLLLLVFCSLSLQSQVYWNQPRIWHLLEPQSKVNLSKAFADRIYNEIKDKIPEHRRPFFERFGWLAIYDYNEYGVLASIKMSQGALETGFGLVKDRGLRYNNYFSIKCRHARYHKGNTIHCFQMNDAGEDSRFLKYDSAFDSFRGHTLHLKSYYPTLFKSHDYNKWADELAKRYAVDPHYATSLKRIIQVYNLNKYDILL